jgi:endonuclease-3
VVTEIPVRDALREKAREIVSALRGEYGRDRARRSCRPTDSLIRTILSQHTADRNSSLAYERLVERYPGWEEIAYADLDQLAEAIRPAGLAHQKARHIQAALREIERRQGDMNLDTLRSLPLEEARAFLLSLPGVGPKTAACVLLFSCDLPALPVDTHVHRLSRRLGLIEQHVSAEGAHDALQALVEPADVYDFHVNLIAHGRRVCTARDPRCGVCVLQTLCSDYGVAAWS